MTEPYSLSDLISNRNKKETRPKPKTVNHPIYHCFVIHLLNHLIVRSRNAKFIGTTKIFYG